MIDRHFWAGKRVYVTGHSGFKGGWLTRTLLALGCRVHGYADTAISELAPGEFANYPGQSSETIGDINDEELLVNDLVSFQPHLVFHLAAQALVSLSYEAPIRTFKDNVVGTANLLVAAKSSPSVSAIVIVTSDKCYLDMGVGTPHVEDHRLGGDDPYSASKACAELVVHAFAKSFFNGEKQAGLASVRAGNVIGGLDWSEDRLIPDFFRAVASSEPLFIRRPHSIRPWQFVLDPLLGYLMLAEQLSLFPAQFSGPWNFGPHLDDMKSVQDLLQMFCEGEGFSVDVKLQGEEFPETNALMISSEKSISELGWRPLYRLPEAISLTAACYRAWIEKGDPSVLIEKQILEAIGDGAE